MKDTFGMSDAKYLHDVFLKSMKAFADNGCVNYILLSGGIDSLCVLYGIDELKLPYKVINFKFPDRESIDTNSVKALEKKMGFDAEYITLEADNMNDIREAVKICRQLFNRVRQVKVETIYAMLQLRKHIPKGVNILSGFGGDGACCYHKKDAILISKVGEDSKEVIAVRHGDKRNDEFRFVFSDWRYYTPFHEKDVGDAICEYTSRAMNRRFPRSALVYTFAEQFKKYKNARKPIGFHKASCEVQMFEDLAKKNGYESALKWFNSI